jgi:hypothetical protein
MGAPGSRELTWAERGGRSPSYDFLFGPFLSGHKFAGCQNADVLYQGTTSVGPQRVEKKMGFSPCLSGVRNKYQFFSKLFSRAADPVQKKRLNPLRYGSAVSPRYAEEQR